MNGAEQKACIFAALVVAVYGIHQVTVGGDGAIFGTVLLTLGSVGGYVIASAKLKPKV